MTIIKFLRDKLAQILIQLAAVGFVALMLNVIGVNSSACAFITTVLLVALAGGMAIEYLKKSGFYKGVESRIATLDQKYLITEIVERPEFIEGKFLYDVMQQANKSMNDRLAGYRRASVDYQEYIETWVHEVKTPIASSRLIIENNKNSVTKALDTELTRIEGFVEQALFYTRSNSVEKDYIIKKVNIKEMVSHCIKKNARALIESKISVELTDLDGDVFTDPKWVDFILGQILSNSIKYRSKEPNIKIYAESGKNNICLSICDNGIGIPEQDIKRVCEKGFTGENGRKYTRSTGVGLYLCNKLCEKLGLGLRVHSQVRIGTTVEIVFPKSKMYLTERTAP